MEQRMKIDISAWTIIKAILIILAFWFLFLVRDIVVLFFIVLIIVAALTPLVTWLSRIMPRTLAIILLSLAFIGILVGIGFLIVPPLILEIKQLAINLPLITVKLGPIYHAVQNSLSNYQEGLINLSSQLGKITTGLYSTTIGFIGGIIAFLTIMVLSFYMLIEQKSLMGFLSNLIPEDRRETINQIIDKFNAKMAQWMGGHFLLMLIVGVCDGIVLAILGVPYALILAIWGGLTELIPYLGPWLGLIPAVVIAFTISPLTALLVVAAYLLIQQLESHFLAPKVLGKAVGLSPVIIILALLAGAKLMGILGMIIAVPVAATIAVIIHSWPEIIKLCEKK